MAVYVDNVRIIWRGRRWCHLVADSISELHDFAKKLGLRGSWFQRNASLPHYDVTVETRSRALELGAVAGSRKQVILCARKLKDELIYNTRQDKQLSLFDLELSVQLKPSQDDLVEVAEGEGRGP